MFESKVFHMPSVIHFGLNATAKAGEEAKRLNCTKALIVTDTALVKIGLIDSVIESLQAEGLAIEIFDKVVTEPTISFVNEGLKHLQDQKCDILVAIGGGSPIDTAKAISVMATNTGQFSDYRGADKFLFPGLPLIAVPTTAGTGSEATLNAVITDNTKNIKMSIASRFLLPKVALVDPLLTKAMPQKIIASTGLDALTHAIEAFVSPKAQPMTDTMALSAIEQIALFLPRAWTNPQDVESRTNMLFGSLQAGIAFSNASVGLVHGMARPLGAYFNIPHGLSNACLLATVMEFCLEYNPERYAKIALAMGVENYNFSLLEIAQEGVKKVKELVHKLEIPTLSDLGLNKKMIEEVGMLMASDAINSGAASNSPRIAKQEEIVNLYLNLFNI